tara:strand:- start:446 stop:715 length:270 start_codon:yes stop_codon:yes gene_type:complete
MTKDREDALDMIAAAMAVIVQVQDIEMSAEIIADAGEIFGRSFVEGLLSEIVASDYQGSGHSIAKDVMKKRAMLSMIRPLPLDWMQTRN